MGIDDFLIQLVKYCSWWSTAIDSWVNKEEPIITDKFISEMCDFIKSENEVLYDRLVKKCALKGISIGEGIFESLNLLNCGMISETQCRQSRDDFSDVWCLCHIFFVLLSKGNRTYELNGEINNIKPSNAQKANLTTTSIVLDFVLQVRKS